MLTRSKDRKVANAVTPNGKQAAIANAFGLPNGPEYSCTNATEYCHKICYAGKLEKIFPGVRTVLLSNWEQLNGADFFTMYSLLFDMMVDFVKECDKRGADKLFRIHWDGDFFSEEYTRAWAYVIHAFDIVDFWVYTRNPDAAITLYSWDLDNLALYFSADPDNIETARKLESLGINIAYVDDTFAKGKEAFPKASRCPENNKAIPLISTKGSACQVCGLCVNGRKDVLFSRTKK